MNNSSPYDLNDVARVKRQIEQERNSRLKRTNLLRSPDGPSPYDLSYHGGLAGLAEKAREDPVRFR